MVEYKSYVPEFSIKGTKSDFKKIKITKSEDAYRYAKDLFKDSITIYESMFIILLNRANNTIGWFKVSQGGISGTVCDPRLICKVAIESLSSAVIMVHNHSSGKLIASDADIRLTKRIKQGLELFDIALLDSLIITVNKWTSLADEGLM